MARQSDLLTSIHIDVAGNAQPVLISYLTFGLSLSDSHLSLFVSAEPLVAILSQHSSADSSRNIANVISLLSRTESISNCYKQYNYKSRLQPKLINVKKKLSYAYC